MKKTAIMRMQVQPNLKGHTEKTLDRFWSATKRTFEATDAGRDLTVCADADELFEKLGL
jgi:hypothetical protein